MSNLDLKLKIDDSTRISIHVIKVEENYFSSKTYHFKMFIDFSSCLVSTSYQAQKFSMGSSVVCKVAYGGTSTGNNLRELQRGCNILVATPGRLLDFVSRGNVVFSNIQFYVLYEADRMLDMGFGPDINKCMTHRTMQTKENLNTLMFSATFPEDVRINARQYLRQDKIFLSVGIVVYVRLFIRLKRKIRREDFWSC